MLLALDPGIRACGVALFAGSQLAACDLVKNPTREGDSAAAVLDMARAVYRWARDHGFAHIVGDGELAFEWPQVYRVGKLKGDPNDLMPLVGVGCALGAFVLPAPVTRYLPHEWKGSIEKESMHHRIIGNQATGLPAKLDEHELAVARHAVERIGAKAHNTLDAIGIGLKHVGRLERRRVFPGAT